MTQANRQQEKSGNLEARLREIAARFEIQAALADYVIGLDERDEKRWLAAFHEDATFDVGFPRAVLHGHAEILQWARDPWRFQTVSHLTGSHRIDFVDDTHAGGIGRGLGLFKLEDGSVILATARLEDRYAERGGSWRIDFRKVSIISSFHVNDVTDLILNGVIVPTR